MAVGRTPRAALRSLTPNEVSPWFGFLARRLVFLVLILLGLAVTTFLIRWLVSGADLRVLPQQLAAYLGNLAHFDLGRSSQSREPVTATIARGIAKSAELAAWCVALVTVVSVPGGMLAAAYTQEGRRPRFEVVFVTLTSVASSIPSFLYAAFLVATFAVWLRLLPVAGSGGLEHLVLPVIAIALGPMFLLARIVRLETLNVLAQDYIRMARSKWLPTSRIYGRYVLPNVLTAALTVGGVLFVELVGGTILIEGIFARVGLGSILVGAVIARDYAVVQGIILVLGCAVVLVNTAVDVILGVIDPRSLVREG